MKTVGIPAVNKRLSNIRKEFGVRSEIYTKAVSFIKGNVSDVNTKYDDAGNIIGIRQTKKAMEDEHLYMRPEALDEYIPSVKRVLLSEANYLKEQYEDEGFFEPKLFDPAIVKQSASKMIVDPFLAPYIKERVEKVFADLNDFDTLKDEVYAVEGNDGGLDKAIYDAQNYGGRAADLSEDIEHTQAWVREARQLVSEYDEACQAQKRREIAEKYK